MGAYTGAFARAYRVERAAPLGRADPAAHADSVEPITRDDAPPTTQIPTPTPFLTREDWLSTYSGPITQEESVRRPHDADGGHGEGNNDWFVAAPQWMDDSTLTQYGGHSDAPNLGSKGAAHDGLRGDNSSSWSNPDGFDFGHDYTNRQSNRRMGSYRMHGALRPIQDPTVAGNPDSPPQTMGRFTSPFNPSASVRTFGAQMPTIRRVQRPNGDSVSTDDGPNFADYTPGIGGGFAL